MTEDAKILMERVNMLYDEIHRVKQCLIDHMEGKPIDLAMDEDVYLEEAAIESKCESWFSRIIEHLLKLQYCTNNMNYNEWIKSVINAQNEIIDNAHWIGDKRNRVINAVSEQIDSIYNAGIYLYNSAAKKYDDLPDIEMYISKKCPWTLEEMLDLSIPDLLDKLEDPDELTTQMQLYPACIYSAEDSRISNRVKMKQCSLCNQYARCIEAYYSRPKIGGKKNED